MLKYSFSSTAQAIVLLAFSTSMAFADASSPSSDALTVPLKGYLNEDSVKDFSENIKALRKQHPGKKIRVEIFNSEGGEIGSGFDLAETLYSVGNVDLVCRGNLKSMTATVFVSFQGGNRIAAQDCTNFMMHDLIQKIWSPTPGARLIRSQIVADAQDMTQAVKIMAEEISKASDMAQESATALFGLDCHLSPDGAYQLSLVDFFEDTKKKAPDLIKSPTPEDIYKICGTSPIEDHIPRTDWSKRHFGPPPQQLVKN